MTQGQALAVMLSGKSVFLTGSPGAGKTYTLNSFIRRAKRRGLRVAVTASTGIAATHIGGTTIHSWSGLGIRDSLSTEDRKWLVKNERLRKRYLNTNVLVIDEVSMLHGKRLDMLNEACKILRESEEPFGGLQVILVGDLFQLPPISRGGEALDFVHNSTAWAEVDPSICYLREQHRQTGGGLLNILETMRAGEMNEELGKVLIERINASPPEEQPITKLYSHNIDVDTINTRHLQAIDSETRSFEMVTTGAKAKAEQLTKSVLAPEVLELKVGAEVMFVANSFSLGFVNGSRGQVVGFKDGMPMVKLAQRDKVITVQPHSWTLTEDERKKAEVEQLPLRLAWAITIHKSQGMSLDAAVIDLSRSFTPGMGYVALSRVRSLNGLYLTGLNAMALNMHPEIFEFDALITQASLQLARITDEIADEPEAKQANEASVNIEIEYDKGLYEQLRSWRLQRAKQDGVAPFIVAHNKLLEELSARPPDTKQKLLAVKGFGSRKYDSYGEDILKITKHFAKVG